MSLSSQEAADAIKNWTTSDVQKKNGYHAYAARVFYEGIAFEKKGDMDNAKLRYEKVRSYCKLRGIDYPPIKVKKLTASMSEARDDAPVKIVREGIHEKYRPVILSAAAKAPEAGEKQLSKASPAATQGEGQAKAATEPSSSVAQLGAAIPKAFSNPEDPTLEPVSDWFGELPAKTSSASNGVQGNPATACSHSEKHEQLGVHETKTPTIPISLEAHGVRGEPATGSGIQPFETGAPAIMLLRKAKVWAFLPNPKLVKIRFEDGQKEFGSIWNTRAFRLNDVVQVRLERGNGSSAIYEEVRKPV